MDKTRLIDFSAFHERRVVLRIWSSIIFAGLLLFGGTLILSYFIFNAPGVPNDPTEHGRFDHILGIGELTGLVVVAIGLLRYLTVSNRYHSRIFSKFIADNGWLAQKKMDINKIASILLGKGESYEQGFGFEGTYNGRAFHCLIFEYEGADSSTKRYICLKFTLPKAYPMIIIDNRLNDPWYWRRGSNLPDTIPDGTTLSLEGDFNKYFRVSTVKGYEQKALIVLSPDFMANLRDRAKDKVDIEISNKNLFLIYEADYYSEVNLATVFATADVSLEKFDKLSRTWLASSKDEEKTVAESAIMARHTLIFRSDYISMAFFFVIFAISIILIISHAQDPSPCAPAASCRSSIPIGT